MMNTKQRCGYIGGTLLIALALTACDPAGPTGQTPAPVPTVAAARTAVPTPSTGSEQGTPPSATAISEPTAEPTVQATAVPAPTPSTGSGQGTAPTAQPTTAPAADTILPNDVPWVFRAGVLFGDDESLDFQERGYSPPGWSFQSAPNGAYIAYISQEDRLVVIDMRGGEQITPEQRDIHVAGFSFSPDSRALAYRVVDGPLQILDLQSEQKQIIPEPQADQPLMLSPVAWTPGGLMVEGLIWGSDALPQGLALVDPASGTITSIRKRDHLRAVVSPDGRRVALVTGSVPIGEAPKAAIAILDIAGGETTIVPERQQFVKALHWSPDGSKLLYAESNEYQSRVTTLHVMGADGTNEQVLEVGGKESGPAFSDIAWHDNGTALLLSAEGGQRLQLYKLPLDSFDITGLQALMGIRRDPDERQDQIVYTPKAP